MLYCVTITEIYIGCLKLHKVKMVSVLFIFSFLCSLKDLTNVPGMKDIANQSSLKSFDLNASCFEIQDVQVHTMNLTTL